MWSALVGRRPKIATAANLWARTVLPWTVNDPYHLIFPWPRLRAPIHTRHRPMGTVLDMNRMTSAGSHLMPQASFMLYHLGGRVRPEGPTLRLTETILRKKSHPRNNSEINLNTSIQRPSEARMATASEHLMFSFDIRLAMTRLSAGLRPSPAAVSVPWEASRRPLR